MSGPHSNKQLQFACECVSSKGGYSDPWAAISQNKLLPDGTKEGILNVLAREPKTIAQLAKEMELSQPSIHRHIGEMMASQLLRESDEWERMYPTERYYEPNFPIVKADERSEFESICTEAAEQMAELFEKRRKRLESAFNKTDLADRGWGFEDIAQYLYATMQRGGREILEERGSLPHREKHRNGVKWLFWAEEADDRG